MSACGSEKELGDGFKEGKVTSSSRQTKSDEDSKNLCSLINDAKAAELLNVSEAALKKENLQEKDDILRCRFSTFAEDNNLFKTLDVYIYETRRAYDDVRKANKTIDIETNVDHGFSYTSSTPSEVRRFVAAIKGDNRIGVSASVAHTKIGQQLSQQQKNLPSLDELASEVGLILSKL